MDFSADTLYESFTRILNEAGRLYPDGQLPEKPAVLVHSSLSSFGYISGGASRVIESLLCACKRKGTTVVMCAHSDPQPDGDITVFDSKRTPCTGMGIICETFRTMKSVVRSAHPHLSFCATGPRAIFITGGHRCEYGLGTGSPLEKLYRIDALILMLGTGYETCTALHLPEYEANRKLKAQGKIPDTVSCHAAIDKIWKLYFKMWNDTAFHPERFPEIGLNFEKTNPHSVIRGKLPSGREYRLFRIREIVNFSIDSYTVLQ